MKPVRFSALSHLEAARARLSSGGTALLVLLLGLSAFAVGCNGNTATPSASADNSGAASVSLTCDRFSAAGNGNQISPVATMVVGAALTVTMCDFGSDGGYDWADPVYDGSALALVGTDSIAPPTGLVGASGSSIWRFRALAVRSSTVTFTDRRVWEEDNPLVVVVITVNVPPIPPSAGASAPVVVPSATPSRPIEVMSSAPTATATPVAVAPSAPTDFSADQEPGFLNPCPPSVSDAAICTETDLAWQSNADPSTWFRVYGGWTGEGPGDLICPSAPHRPDVAGGEQMVFETAPGVRSATLVSPILVGGGAPCLWLTAVNQGGESLAVAAMVLTTP